MQELQTALKRAERNAKRAERRAEKSKATAANYWKEARRIRAKIQAQTPPPPHIAAHHAAALDALEEAENDEYWLMQPDPDAYKSAA